MKRVLVICGPTGTGKTALGIRLAKKINGEIVSADSRQVYIGMNVGTGKDINNFKFQISNLKSISNDKFQIGYYKIEEIKTWLYDVVDPDYQFSVADYVKCANLVIEDIWRRKKLPILVGGTGFYIKAVVDGIPTKDIPPNWQLRKQLEKKTEGELFDELSHLDPFRAAKMNISDRNNPRRLVRAIEIARWQMENRLWQPEKHPKIDTLLIGLTIPYKNLYQRIDERIEKQIKMGAEKEIKTLLAQGYSWDLPAMTALGYGEWRPCLEGKATRREVITRWKFNEHAYARRQMTWFKKDKRIYWFDISKKEWQDRVEELVSKW